MYKRYSNDKDINKYIAKLIKSGICIYQASRNHGKLIFNNNKTITVSNSPSDHRTFKNLKCDVKRIIS